MFTLPMQAAGAAQVSQVQLPQNFQNLDELRKWLDACNVRYIAGQQATQAQHNQLVADLQQAVAEARKG